MDASVEVLIILLFVGLSAVFSGMETALVSLTDVKLRRRLESGKKASVMLTRWRDAPNDVLATLLIGNNLVNITASALATDTTYKMLAGTAVAGWGIPIAVGVMTLLVLIFGEVVPKTYAKHNPERYLVLLPVTTVTYWLFYPWMKVLVRLTGVIVGWLGGELDGRDTVTEEDIEEMVRIGRNDGSMSAEATKLLTGVFELDDKLAREVMVPRTDVKALPLTASMDDIIEMLTISGYSRYPVYGENIDNIVGVLYVKDFFAAALSRKGSPPPKIADIMREPMVRPWNVNVQDLLGEMQRERVHLAVIVSEYGGVAGILTLEDIVEEVFGPIYDEHDHRVEPLREQADGSWIVEGSMTIRELGMSLDHQFPEDVDYETVAGMLMKEAGTIPTEGFTLQYEGYCFGVLNADATRVLEVSITEKPDAEAQLASAS